MATTVGLSTHIWNNNLRSIMLLAFYPVLMLTMFWGICWALSMSFVGQSTSTVFQSYYSSTSDLIDNHKEVSDVFNPMVSIGFANNMMFDYAPIIIAGVAIWFTIAWFFHTNMIRRLSHSHPVSRGEEPELYNLLENLCISRGMKMPKLEVIETHARNAFASGISDKSFSITVTRGLMNSLAKDELEGVLAHELTHIINRDVRLLIVTVIFTGLFGFLAQLVWSNIRYSIFYSGGRRSKNGGGVVIAMIIIAVILWLGYMASLLMRFALSRRREYMADAGAVEMTKNPEAMMRALMRIAGRDRIPETTDDIAMMCIENRMPFLGMFATHPPIDRRIEMLSVVTNTPVPETSSLPPIAKEESFSATKEAGEEPRRPNPWLIRDRRN